MNFQNLPFMSREHKDFFEYAMHETGTAYPPNIAGIYLLSASENTRADFYRLVDLDGNFLGLPEDWRDMTADPDTRRLMALAANLAVGDGPYPDLSSAYLYSGPYASIFKAATDYWYRNTRAE